jgi:hypothetical protein
MATSPMETSRASQDAQRGRWSEGFLTPAWRIARAAARAMLMPRPVVAQDSKGLMQWSLPALGTTWRAACDLDVTAVSCARWSAIAWPPVEGYRAGPPRVTEAALLREARKLRVPWLFHELHSNI